MRHIVVLLAAAVLTGIGQLLLKHLSSGNGIDTTAAIWFHAGRMPALRTLGSAVLSVIIVGLGVSLGREGAPKQAGAVFANFFSDKGRLSDEQRRLLVACGAGAGMGAAYGVPLGGALFALEVMRGKLALRFVLPALFASMIAAGVSWFALPNAPTYVIPTFVDSASIILWALVVGPIAGLASVGYVRMVTWADRNRPKGWGRITAPIIVIGALGIVRSGFRKFLETEKTFRNSPSRPSRASFAARVTRSKARSNDLVHAQWGARRDVHAIADIRSHARRRVRAPVVTLLARRSTRNICVTRSWGCAWSYNSGPDIRRGSNDGIDGKRSFFHLADATCRGNCDTHSA